MISLDMSIHDYAQKISDARRKQKEKYKSSNPLSPNYELVGVLGEMVYGYITNECFDIDLKAEGDDGFDFKKKVQVKTSEEYKARHLIEYTDKDLSKFDYYVFVIVNLKKKTGYIKGWISTKDFIEKAEIIDFGYGERLSLELEELNEWKPKKKKSI